MNRWKRLLQVGLALIAALVFVLIGQFPRTQPAVSALTPEQVEARTVGLKYLKDHLVDYGLTSLDDVAVKSVKLDRLSMAHVRFQQRIGGVPVFGGEGIVHLNSAKEVSVVTDNFVKGLRVNFSGSRITDAQAAAKAVNDYGCLNCLTGRPLVDLWVLRYEGQDHLVYRVRLQREDGSEQTAFPVYFIDAYTGETVWNYNNLQTGTGVSLYSGNQPLNTFFYNGSYYLEDHNRAVGTWDARNSRLSFRIIPFSDSDDFWDDSRQNAAVDAQFGAAETYDYFLGVHGRNGIDDQGGPTDRTSVNGVKGLITSVVHYGRRYNNAFWNGSRMTYGDGDGTNFTPLASMDVAGHEMTHGVTQYSANLVYADESGAMNESMSDVFGALIERYAKGASSDNWKIGEEIFTPNTPGDALRYLDNPHAASDSGFTADDDPDHYSERYTGTADNGGVHINSGIGNFAFYLLAQGGTHHLGGSMTGIGADKAAQIWYEALTNYMTSSTDFRGARVATINAANALYGSGSTEANAVAQAWALCGVLSPA